MTLLVFVLGILSLTSVGIMTLSVVEQLRPVAFTAINKQLNYQGKLQNAGGITLPDGNYSMKFSVYDAAAAGTRLWTECGTVGTPTARTVAVANGVFSVLLGDTASGACPGPANANAITLDFNSDAYYLGLTVEADSEMTPRKRLGASGYAFNADLLDGLNTSAAGGSNAFVPVTDASGHLTLTQNLTLGGVFKNSDGSAASPSYTFTNDPNTGFYSAAGNNIGVAANGAMIAYLMATTNYTDSYFYSPRFITPATTNYPMTLTGRIDDGAAAVGVILDNSTTLATAGAKIVSFKNNTTEKAAIGLNGEVMAGAGTALLPALSFLGDPNTGFYTYSANQIGIANDGGITGVFSSGSLYINYILALSGNTLNLTGSMADGGTAVGVKLGSSVDLTVAGSKIASFVDNNTTEKSAIGLNGEIMAGAGTALLPSLSFLGDPNSGMYTYASDTLGFAVGGTAVGVWDGSTIYVPAVHPLATTALTLKGRVADGGTAVGVILDNTTSLTTAGAKLVSIKNATVEKAYIDKDGNAYLPGLNVSGLTASLAVYTDGSKNLTSTAPTSGAIGYWSRATTTLSPTTANDNISVSSNVTGAAITGTASATGAVINYGVYGTAAGNSAKGVYGSATATGAVLNFGGDFYAAGNSGQAVRGTASATGAVTNYGGVFYAAGDTGFGIVADATSTNAGQNFGGYFYARGTTGVAVFGNAPATGAVTNYGGSFQAAGNSGQAVRGNATATGAAANYGGTFYSAGNSGVAVYGSASATGAVTNYGGQFYSAGDTGMAVFGYATGAGLNYGIYGSTNSASGWSGYFNGGLGMYASAARINSLTASSAVYTDASKNLTSTAPTSGAIGYWSRSSTTLSTATAGDIVSLSGGLNMNASPITASYISTNPWGTNSVGSANGVGLQMNRLLGANTGRYTVTSSGINTTSVLFDNFYDSAGTIAVGDTGVITVDFNPQLAWTASTATGFVYQNGIIVMSFYNTVIPTDVTVEVYRCSPNVDCAAGTGTDAWVTIYSTTTNDKNPLVISPTPSVNYIKRIRFTFADGDPTYGSWISELEWFPTRDASANQLAVLPKYFNQSLDVSWTSWNMKKVADWSTTATISNAGAAYFAGPVGVNDAGPDASLEVVNDGSGDSFLVADTNDGDATPFVIQADGDVGIGTAAPAALLHIAKDSTYNSEAAAGIKITDSTLTDTGLLLGADATNDIAYIQSMDPGTGYTRALSINPNGGMTRLFMNRGAAAGTGISWYLPTFTAWAEYMAQATQTLAGPTANITAPSGTIVTSWALRSFIENASNYGWTFESGTSTGQPSVVAEIRSSDGTIRSNTSVLAAVSMGIGDDTPDASLEVVNDGSGDSFLVADTNDGDATPFVIDPDGDVGIGTTGPLTKFHVNSANTLTGSYHQAVITSSDTAAIDKGGSIGFGGAYTGTTLTQWAGISGRKENVTAGNYAGYLALETRANGGNLTEQVRIDSAGSVGIGTTGPDRKLDVLAASSPQLRLTQVDNTTYADFQVDSNGDLIMNVDGISSQLVLDNGGNIGIGTAAPAGALDIVSANAPTLRLATNATDATVKYGYVASRHYTNAEQDLMVFMSGSSATENSIRLGGGSGSFNATNRISFYTAADQITLDGTERMKIDSSGNIWINSLDASSIVYTDASKNLTSTPPGAGTIGYWSRGGTTLSPATANDVVSVSGTGATAITGTSSAAGGKGIYGTATDATAVANYGVYGTAAGTGALSAGVYGVASGAANSVTGVYAEASNTGAYENYGGAFFARGETGVGIYGEGVSTAAAVNYGGKFSAHGKATGSAAVYGAAPEAGAFTSYGGYFTTVSDTGRGVYGSATASGAVTNYGGYFTSAGTGILTSGVYGEASGAANNIAGIYGKASNTGAYTNFGGVFYAAGETGIGIRGEATSTAAAINFGAKFYANGAASGTAGVYGQGVDTTAIVNYGGYFNARGTATGASGVYGEASGAGAVYGVYGNASATGAVTNYGGVFYAAGDSGRGLYSNATATGAVTNYGGYFSAAGNSGAGIYGTATATGAITNYGGVFYAAGDSGAGVYGTATSTTGTNFGGYFIAAGTGSDTAGVYGSSTGTGGTKALYGGRFIAAGAVTGTAGVYGSASGAGTVYGVQGNASDTGAVTNYGGYFTAAGDTGRGVYGAATDSGAVANYGGYFTAAGTSSASGIYAEATGAGLVSGVYGLASDATAGTANFGGYFEARGPHSWSYGVKGYIPNSVGGKAVWGHAAETTSTNYGGYFKADGAGAAAAGVYGWASGAAAVYGVQGYASDATAVTNYGGYFSGGGQTGRGVYGSATYTGATTNYGGFFEAAGTSFATGVYGRATGAGTVYGVQGIASDTTAVTNYGGYFIGWGDTGYGVYGEAGDTGAGANYGGYFKGRGSGGAYGVYALADAASGTNYAVYGNVTSSTGYGGYFTGGYGLYGSRGQIARAPSGNDTSYALVVEGAVCIDDSSANCPSTPTSGTLYTEGAALQTFDLAELYESTEALAAGDVVSVDTGSARKIVKSTEAYQNTTMGVISTAPGITLGGWSAGPNQYPVALAGRVPVKVSDENGPIAIGDILTSSSTTGVAMKATRPGQKIGVALEAWSGTGVGVLEVFMAPGWDSAGTIATDGTAIFLNDTFTFNKLDTADNIIQGYGSKGLSFRGSGWDGTAGQNVEMKLLSKVTDATNYKLAVLNNAGEEVAYVGGDGSFGVTGKFYPAATTGAQTDAYIFYAANYMRTNADGWSTGSFDFAEMFLSHELLEAGDIVTLDEATNEYVKKSVAAYDNMALGIVSTKPGFLAGTNVDFNNPSADQGYPIALAGRVPTKVSAENGPIRPGDFLTTSATSGVAMKATESGMILGTALESFDGQGIGLVKVFVNLSWYNVASESTPVGEMAQLTLTGDLNMAGNYILNVGKIVGVDEKWSIDENGILKVKLIAEDASEKEMFGLTSAKVELTLSGTGRLENGTSMIDLSLIDPDFAKNISAETPIKVIVTLTEPANGIYVAEKSAYGFRVAELNAGTTDAAFDWIVIARRKGYEDVLAGGEVPLPSEPAPSAPAPSEPVPSEPAPEVPPSEPPPEVPPSEPAPSETPPPEPAPTEPTP